MLRMPPLEEFPRSHTSEAPNEDNYSKSGNKRQPEKQISEVRFRDLCSYYGEACEGYDGNVVGHEHSLVPPREFGVGRFEMVIIPLPSGRIKIGSFVSGPYSLAANRAILGRRTPASCPARTYPCS